MLVTKRCGEKQSWNCEKITKRLERLVFDLDKNHVDPEAVVQRLSEGLYNGVSTFEIDNLMSETIAAMTTLHPDYSTLAARVAVTALHKTTSDKFSNTVSDLYNIYDKYTHEHRPEVSKELYDVVQRNYEQLDGAIDYTRDLQLNYFGFKTLEKAYLLKKEANIIERPQHLFMRVAVGIHGDDTDKALETYDLMSRKYFIHASPTLFNAGTLRPQMSSCFLVAMKEDSIDGIYDTLRTCALISKTAGGIGLHVHDIRASGSSISGGGRSNGLVPMLRVFNNTARYVDQGGNKRPGAFAIYVEPWHADIFEFLDLRKNHGKEEVRARDLFYALWIPDLFMEKVEKNEDWCLFCPRDAPGLADVYGDEFVELYLKYEKLGRARRTVKAQTLWYSILEAQTETGTPFMLYKDACNRKTNQKNLGVIKSSNLCTEIVQFSSPEEVAVCNLASVALPTFVRIEEDRAWYDFGKLHSVVKVIIRNLNRIIDINDYPVEAARRSNLKHRPVAVGVQGLADTFLKLRLPFDSDQAKKLNVQIFETIYHAAVESSAELAKELGPYETYQGSPASEGKLQYHLWDTTPTKLWNWHHLEDKVAAHGLRNSLLVAPMPTASTSQIMGFNECFEPFTSNIYTRRVLSGEFQVVNPYMLKDLVQLGIWNESLKHRIIADNGSIQSIDGIPDEIKDLYRTVWEIPQRTIIDMAADRAPFIDQSQSMNIHLKDCTMGKLTSMHFYGWRKGLKTGMYYLRTQAASRPIQFTVDQQLAASATGVRNGNGNGNSNGSSTSFTPDDPPPPERLRKRKYIEAISILSDTNDGSSSGTSSRVTPKESRSTATTTPKPLDIYNEDVIAMCTPDSRDNCDSCSG